MTAAGANAPSSPAPGKKAAGAGAGLAGAIALIVAAVVSVEGGYVHDPNDPGGKTSHGVTETVARAEGYTGDMRALTRAQASDIYARQYVVRPGFDRIVARSVALGEEVVDTGVNLGTHRAGCYVQTALNALNRQQRDWRDVTVDCAVGPATMAAYDALAARRGSRKACELVLKLVEAQQGAHYLSLARSNSKFETFMPGWADHRLGNVPLARCGEGGAE
jgi:lysozyme family protein